MCAAAQVWPIILAGRDLIGIAATGSGKTLGFGLPMLRHIEAQKAAGVVGQGKGPYAIVMAPTRELALQINQVRTYGLHLQLSVSIIDGTCKSTRCGHERRVHVHTDGHVCL